MTFCNQCGALLSPTTSKNSCNECDPAGEAPLARTEESFRTTLETLSSTASGTIRKRDATRWLEGLDRPTPTELKRAILPKPADFEGSTYETDISNIRLTGDPQFIETIAGLLTPLLDLENDETRLEINLQRTQVRDTNQYTGNYALYLSIAERSK